MMHEPAYREDLRLYGLRDRNGKLVAGVFFPDKQSAKLSRNERNRVAGMNRYAVTYGPDHKRWQGE